MTGLALTLLVLRVLADDTHHATAVNDLALVTDLLYGCTDLHVVPFEYTGVRLPAWQNWILCSDYRLNLNSSSLLLVAVDNAATVEIVRAELNRDAVAGEDADEVFAHAS